MERHRKGDLTEAVAIAALKRRNIPVSTPVGDNERYDLLAETPRSNVLKLQVKTAQFRDGTVRFKGKSQHTNTRGSTYRLYGNDIDYFIAYCDALDTIYLVPGDEVNTSVQLRVDPPETDHPAVRWAKEYEFDRRWPDDDLETVSEVELQPHRRGDATEAQVIAELLRREIQIATPPTDNERFDLLIKTPLSDDFLRIQIKTGWINDGVIHFKSKTTHVNSQGNVNKPYDGDVDYFIVFVPPLDELYLIAEQAFDTNITLRVEESKRALRNTKWAEDYEFDRNWPPEESPSPTSSRDHPRDEVIREAVVEKLHRVDGTVARPVRDDVPSDLLVETPDDGFLRMAIRTVQRRAGRISFHSDDPNPDGIDVYLLYCQDFDRVYALGADAFDTSVSLWVDEPKEIKRTTKWAKDFELDRNWPPTRVFSERSTVGSVIEELQSLALEIAYPADDRPYDLLVRASDDDFLRVAVEPGWISNGRIRLNPDSCTGIDAFLLYCRELDTCYLIEPGEFDASIHLRVEPPEQEKKTINWAQEYELPTRLPELG